MTEVVIFDAEIFELRRRRRPRPRLARVRRPLPLPPSLPPSTPRHRRRFFSHSTMTLAFLWFMQNGDGVLVPYRTVGMSTGLKINPLRISSGFCFLKKNRVLFRKVVFHSPFFISFARKFEERCRPTNEHNYYAKRKGFNTKITNLPNLPCLPMKLHFSQSKQNDKKRKYRTTTGPFNYYEY